MPCGPNSVSSINVLASDLQSYLQAAVVIRYMPRSCCHFCCIKADLKKFGFHSGLDPGGATWT
jgi:hypothetical protein